MTIEQIKALADNARVPYHTVEVGMVGDELWISVHGIEDTTATAIDTRAALNRVGDAIGISDELWVTGRFWHSGSYASVRFPLADVVADVSAQKSDEKA